MGRHLGPRRLYHQREGRGTGAETDRVGRSRDWNLFRSRSWVLMILGGGPTLPWGVPGPIQVSAVSGLRPVPAGRKGPIRLPFGVTAPGPLRIPLGLPCYTAAPAYLPESRAGFVQLRCHGRSGRYRGGGDSGRRRRTEVESSGGCGVLRPLCGGIRRSARPAPG